MIILPFPKQQTLDSSKLKQFADDSFQIDDDGRESFKIVENTVGTGEMAHYDKFLPFPQYFL